MTTSVWVDAVSDGTFLPAPPFPFRRVGCSIVWRWTLQELDIALALLGQDRIAEKLECAKEGGRISEYLVSWRGSGGQLDPNVTVWTEPDDDGIKHLIVRSLSGLVSSENIRVLTDNDGSRGANSAQSTMRPHFSP
jgi:hypothetical protein